MGEETFECERCGRATPRRRLKEVAYEDGKERVLLSVCPTCLDEIMNEAGQVRGIAGRDKAAAVHVQPGEGKSPRQSFGTRDSRR